MSRVTREFRRAGSIARMGVVVCVLFTSLCGFAQSAPPKPDAKPADAKAADAKKPDTSKAAPKSNSKGSKLSKEEAEAAAKVLSDPNSQPEYTVGVGDTMTINVWKEPEVSGPVQIRGDCRITLPLVKELEVCGMTPTQIQDLLVEKLGKFIAAPDVTVVLMGINSRKIFFVGNFKRQGGMILNGPMTIAQALSDAGGVGEFANGKKVTIRRPQKDGTQKEFIFNYNDFLKGKKTTENILLEPGDTIIVK
jgi:polysaccharide export outer membrane protein